MLREYMNSRLFIVITGVLVSLTLGFSMVGGTLSLPWWLGGSLLTLVVGWLLIVATIINTAIEIIER